MRSLVQRCHHLHQHGAGKAALGTEGSEGNTKLWRGETRRQGGTGAPTDRPYTYIANQVALRFLYSDDLHEPRDIIDFVTL